MKVTILNWKKYNARMDVKSTSWLRLNNDFCSDAKMFKYDCEQRMVFIYILCEASRAMKDEIEVDCDLVAALLKMPSEKVREALDLFSQEPNPLISFECNIDVTPKILKKISRDEHVTTRTNEQTNERTNEQESTASPKLDLDYQVEVKVLESWNSLDIVNHKPIQSSLVKIRKHLKVRLKNYSLDQILQAMCNYQEAIKDGWFNYRWSLWEFLQRENANKFYPGNYIRENFIRNSNSDKKFDRMMKMDNPYAKESP